jgi:hypothetical protein
VQQPEDGLALRRDAVTPLAEEGGELGGGLHDGATLSTIIVD